MAKNMPVATEPGRPGADRPGDASGFRHRFARLAGPRSNHPELEPVLRDLRRYHPKADTRLVARAYEMASYLHRDQERHSGEPYITHPLAITAILADLGMPAPTLAAALLHDTVEDCGYSLDALREDFGDEVALLVDGVTKLDKVTYGEASAAETVRKMVVAMARDIRVLVIKLVDRLHNMRTLQFLPEEKQQKKAKETLEIYAPLAHRLGMNTIKWELEDLSFATMYPKMYEEIVRLVGERAPSREKYLTQVISDIDGQLKSHRIKASVSGRPKHYYSVYQKMIVRGRDFNDIYDLVGVRILVDSVRDCYAVLGTIHAKWSPVPGRFKDFIAMPKFNMYQSLHTTVIGPDGKVVEVQIRTTEMHQAAELGVAAHWKYKQSDSGKAAADDFAWLRQLLEWQRETADPSEFLDSLRYDLGAAEVYVFTPKGDVMALPSGATPVDFAYSVHTEVGHRCVGARVNGKLVPLESQLASGDVVERRWTESRLAELRRIPAGKVENQGVVLQRTTRRSDGQRQGSNCPRDAQEGPSASALDDQPGSRHDCRRLEPGRHLRAVRLRGRGSNFCGDDRPKTRRRCGWSRWRCRRCSGNHYSNPWASCIHFTRCGSCGQGCR